MWEIQSESSFLYAFSPPQTVKGCSNSEWRIVEKSLWHILLLLLTSFGEKKHRMIPADPFCLNSINFYHAVRLKPGVLSHACWHLQPQLWDIQIISLELSVGLMIAWFFAFIFHVFSSDTSVSICALMLNAALMPSFALLTDDKAATAKNDRTEKNSPEGVGKCSVPQSLQLTYWKLLTVEIPKTWLQATVCLFI